jgi:tetratricopeptide (TPR) repeat protein
MRRIGGETDGAAEAARRMPSSSYVSITERRFVSLPGAELLARQFAEAFTGRISAAANVPRMLAANIERVLIRLAIGLLVAAAVAGIVSLTPPGRALLERMTGNGVQTTGHGPVIDQAETALQRGDLDAAKRLAARAIDHGPPDASIDYRAGNVQLAAGDEKRAEADYLTGEQQGATYPWNFIAIGQLYARQGKLLEADANLRAAIGIAPTIQFLHYDLGAVELREGLYAAAQADFDRELTITPGYRPAIQGKADATELLRKHGIVVADVRPRPSPTPSLAIPILIAPSPSPTPTPQVAPSPTETPTSSPSPTPTPTSTPSPSPTPAATHKPHKAVPVTKSATVHHHRPPSPTPLISSAPPPNLAAVASDARSYLLGEAQDLSFTHALPAADTSDSPAQLAVKIGAAHSEPDLLRLGTGALLQGDLGAAASAFSTASSLFPGDWRPAYLAGLTAQARGDDASARVLFATAARIGVRPEPYTSLAIEALNAGDVASALSYARRAGVLDPQYEPARFTAGMIAILAADAPLARRELGAAISLGGAPERAGFFLVAAGG